MQTRRTLVLRLAAGAVLGPTLTAPLWAQARATRVDKVLWGGLGYSSKHSAVEANFPHLTKAIGSLGYPKLVSAFTQQLGKSYPAGLVDDPLKMIDANSDPSLLFTVSLDYEQMILVPNEGGSTEFQLSFIYALAQVLYFDLPRPGQSDGEIRILYSFPFRVQSGETPRINQPAEQIANFRKLLVESDNSLVDVFARKVSTKHFRDAGSPKKLKVRSASLTPEAAALINSLGIGQALSADFFGQAFTASVAEHGELSMLPYTQNNTLGSLANRFNKFPNISKVFERFTSADENDYVIDLSVHRALRQSNGGNIANVLYARGMSVFVTVTDTLRNQVVFNKKIMLIENNELPKSMFARLQDYDLRYMVQIAIKLFDTFVIGVMKDDPAALKTVGLDPAKDAAEVAALKELWLKCRYV